MFTLEAVKAFKGDSLLLHYGSDADRKLILIDGGAKTTYNDFLKPRLEQLAGADEKTRIRMLMVSHIDDDHIRGILDLFQDMKKAEDRGDASPYRITSLWHNSFDDLLGNNQVAAFNAAGLASAGDDLFAEGTGEPDGKAVLASVNQGRKLRDLARPYVLDLNGWFGQLVQATYDAERDTVRMGSGLTLRVVAPAERELRALQAAWDEELRKHREGKASVAELVAYLDKSAYNLSSIVVLAELNGKRMLLTGDARGDLILEGLERSGLLTEGGIDVDLLKMPHHGSDRNVETEFFRRVRAQHYVFSGNGEHDNPETGTLEMIADAVGDRPIDFFFTYRLPKLDAFFATHSPAYRVHYPGEGELSVSVELDG